MNDVDIGLFEFDYDLTWACFFMDGADHIYSRYGGRDAGNAEARVSVAGLKHTMRQVLADHKPPATFPPPRRPFLANQVFTRARGCMHCHNVWEGLREKARAEGTFTPESLFVYPPPENIGLTLDVTIGNQVNAVAAQSPADKAGLRPGDLLTRIQETEIRSQGDVMRALHLAPQEGSVSLQWRREGQVHSASIPLARGWRETKLAWRASLRNQP